MNGRQTVLMAGAFGLTFALLAGTFLALQGLARDPDRPLFTPRPSLVAVTSGGPLPTPFRTRHPAGTPTPDPARLPQTTRPPTPTRKPAAQASAAASAVPTPAGTASADGRIRVVLAGSDYEFADVPENGTLTRLPGGGIRLESTRIISAQLMVTWFPPAGSIPAGATITDVDVVVCGRGEGDFYETYGPLGSDPAEHEVEAPSPDGCWHYDNAYGDDLSVIAITRLQSRLDIERVEYTITVQ